MKLWPSSGDASAPSGASLSAFSLSRRLGFRSSRGLGCGRTTEPAGTFVGPAVKDKTASAVEGFSRPGSPGERGTERTEEATAYRLDPRGVSTYAGVRVRRSRIVLASAQGISGQNGVSQTSPDVARQTGGRIGIGTRRRLDAAGRTGRLH